VALGVALVVALVVTSVEIAGSGEVAHGWPT
jgi:hypothetical protein